MPTLTAESFSSRVFSFGALVLACLMFAGQGTAIKSVGGKLGPIQITFLPFTTSTILLIPLLVRSRMSATGGPKVTRADWRSFIVAGVFGQVVAQLGVVWGIRLSLASNGAILALMLPVISTILASIMLKERITGLRALSLAIGLAGVLLLSAGNLKQSSFFEMRYLTGNLLIVAGMCGSAFYNVYCKGLFDRFPQIEVMVFSYFAAALGSMPLLVWAEPVRLQTLAELGWRSWLALSYQALFTYGLAMLLFFTALKHLDVAVASLSLYLLPVFGVVLAAILLGERLGAAAICGTAVVLTATLLIVRYEQIGPRPEPLTEVK